MKEHKELKNFEHINFPENLTEVDIQLVIKQCQIQNALEDFQMQGFAEAYSLGKKLFEDRNKLEKLTPEEVLKMIKKFGELCEPEENKHGRFRKQPVYFDEGRTQQAVPAPQIEGRLDRFSQFFIDGTFTPEEAYIWFEETHPFRDGNGRVGDLLWKLAVSRVTGKWPGKLPPNVFNEKR